MRMLAALAVAFCLAPTLVCAQPQARGLQVSPVIMSVREERPITSFRVRNSGAAETSIELAAMRWSQEGGEFVLEPTTDVIVAPSVFLLEPGREQIVRVGVRGPPSGRERAYRIVLRELPRPDPVRRMRLRLEMSMPLFVAAETARGQLAVRRTRDESGAPAIVLENRGDAHLVLADPSGRLAPLPRYLLPGARVTRPLPAGETSLALVASDVRAPTPAPQTFRIEDAPVLADLR
ncbi:MAG: molecular chaperone [Hyphomonadaceae bacterium]|nr:molecular chaperone [Hyphomonadaceae bacterium]